MKKVEESKPQYITYKEYAKMEGRWEVLEGVPRAMTAPLIQHQLILQKLFIYFQQSVSEASVKCWVIVAPCDWKVKEHTIVQPDLVITCKKLPKKYLIEAPELIVEILSPFTALFDRNEKFNLYEKEGVKYYLIVDIYNRTIEFFQLYDGKYQRKITLSEGTFKFELTKDCNVNTNFTGLWEVLPEED